MAMNYSQTLTTCPYCGCGCGLYLLSIDGRLEGVLPSKQGIVNQGKLCVKGWNAHEFVHNPNRLTHPLLRTGNNMTPTSWEEALDYTSRKLIEIKSKFGKDSIGFFASARITNEENYLFQKFARAAVGTNNVDHCARLCHSSTVAGLAAAFGSGAMTNSIEELAGADVIFVIGSNTTATHPLVANRLFRAKARGAKIILADPRRIQLSLVADVYVSQKLGSDVALINGMMNVILNKGWHDKTFIEERTEGFAELRETLEKYPPEKVAEITGVPAGDIEKMALLFSRAEKASIVYCMGITQHTTGVDNVKSLANLSMLTGQIGRESTGVNPLRGQNNVQGACDMGGLPNVYPGYQSVTSPEVRARFEKAWGVTLSDKVGLTIPDMVEGLENGKIKALYIVGENPVMSDPDVNHLTKALKKADLLILQDIFFTETASYAHVVLPGVSFAEKLGTFTNTERRVQLVRQAVPPFGESRQDWEIIQDLSTRLGYPMSYESPSDIMDEIASVTPQYGGISHKRLEDGKGLCWPCPHKDHPGTRFLHQGRFTKGLGTFHAVDYREPAEVVDEDYPLWLTTGRAHVHYHTGSMTRNSPTLEAQMPEGFAEIHPYEASKTEVREGQMIRLITRRGAITAKAMITDRVKPGMVFVPFHFVESSANVLTNSACDPIVKIPEYKVCAAKLERVN